MSTHLPLRCACGRVHAEVIGFSPATSNRMVCYCDDCQAFARFLSTPGVLDVAGGTEIVQVAPAHVRITAGGDQLRCIRLSTKGLHRWYSDCCRTPLANTHPRVAFVGLIHSFIDAPREGHARDGVLGPTRFHAHAQSATGPLPPSAPPKANVAHMTRIGRLVLGWWIGGLGRPSPFFDPRSRAPRTVPRVLDANERAALGA